MLNVNANSLLNKKQQRFRENIEPFATKEISIPAKLSDGPIEVSFSVQEKVERVESLDNLDLDNKAYIGLPRYSR